MCEFTLKPTCSDGIKNCHDGSCEVLTDCGGPCSACATCSDKIQNQGEKGIDCGGPCPKQCPVSNASKNQGLIYVFLLILLIILILIIIAIIKLIRSLREKRSNEEFKWYRI